MGGHRSERYLELPRFSNTYKRRSRNCDIGENGLYMIATIQDIPRTLVIRYALLQPKHAPCPPETPRLRAVVTLHPAHQRLRQWAPLGDQHTRARDGPGTGFRISVDGERGAYRCSIDVPLDWRHTIGPLRVAQICSRTEDANFSSPTSAWPSRPRARSPCGRASAGPGPPLSTFAKVSLTQSTQLPDTRITRTSGNTLPYERPPTCPTTHKRTFTLMK